MKMRSNTSAVTKVGATALAFCLVAGNVAAATHCASTEEVTALKVAALRQKLMVAALTCHEAPYFNRFVISYREALNRSDRTLMRFFIQQDRARADEAYNAYKTKLANDSSMRSLSDPWFCSSARASLTAALDHNMSLSELVADEPRPMETDFESCSADNRDLQVKPAPRHGA